MQITSINNLLIKGVIALLMFYQGASAYAVGVDLPFANGQGVRINYANEIASIYRGKRKLIADKSLLLHLKRTDEVVYLLASKINQGKWPFFLVLSREPSRINRSAGFCGAGYEDYVLLLQTNDTQIKLKDKFLLQSCNESKTLSGKDIDGLAEPLKAIKINEKRHQIIFALLSEPDKQHVLSVDGNHKIFISDIPSSK
jgi:hypothetical protein